MNNEGFGKEWKFCEACGCILRPSEETGGWNECSHDWRPNSSFKVLENQRLELEFTPSLMAETMDRARCYQSPIELYNLVCLVDANQARKITDDVRPVIVEIGSFHGGTSAVFDAFLDPKLMICVDRTFEFWMADKGMCHQVCGDTRENETLEQVKTLLAKSFPGDAVEKVDFLFIDGDHSQTGAINDYEKYSPLVRPGGIIAFHDTVSIPVVREVFDNLPGKKKVLFSSYQGIGAIYK